MEALGHDLNYSARCTPLIQLRRHFGVCLPSSFTYKNKWLQDDGWNDANLEVVGNQYGTENLFLLSMGRGTTQKSRGG